MTKLARIQPGTLGSAGDETGQSHRVPTMGSSPWRLTEVDGTEEILRQACRWLGAFGVDVDRITADEVKAKYPLT
jgi:hypothetical protein